MFRDKRILKNGAIGAYVKQKNGSWRWRIIGRVGVKKVMKGGNKKTLALFHTPWCGYCKMFKPTFDKFKKLYKGDVNIVSINCDKQKKIARKHRVNGYPTVRLYHNGLKNNRSFKEFNDERSLRGLYRFVKNN